MYYDYFESLGLDLALLQKYDSPIYGFNNQLVLIEGVLMHNVAFGSGRTYVTSSVWFLVVKIASLFNVVIGRPILTEILVVVSQPHICMKFPTPMRIAMLKDNQEAARHYYMTSVIRPEKIKKASQTFEAKQLEVKVPQAEITQQVMGVEMVDNRPNEMN